MTTEHNSARDRPDAGSRGPFRSDAVASDPDHSVLAALTRITGEAPKLLLRDEGSAHAFSPLLKRSTEGASLPRGRGQYQLLGEIARGGMGVVLKGHDLDLGRDVAVKVMHAELAKRPDILQRFVEEAQIGGQLQHPGIVPVYELGLMADDRPYFAMKLVKGKTLASLLSERKSPSDERRHFLDVFESMCQTLAYCHSRGVIHRDLKPSNVMVGAFGEVQVVDWGLSKVIRQGGNDDERRAKERHTQISIIETVRSGSSSVGTDSVVGSIMGTVAYMPPEQARGDVDRVDERSDVFALGAILCEILTGLPPYPGQREEAVSNAAMGRTEAAFERLDGCGVEKSLIELTKECLLPAQDARPRNAQVLAQRIKAYLGSVEERATQARIEAAEAQVKAGEERKARKLTLLLAGSVLVTLLVGGGGWVAMRMEREARTRKTSEQVNAALSEVGIAQGSKDWSGAQAAVARARAAAAGGVVTEETEARIEEVAGAVENGAQLEQQRLEREARNVAFLERLDSIRSLGSAPMSVARRAGASKPGDRSSSSGRYEERTRLSFRSDVYTPAQREAAYVRAFQDHAVDVDAATDADVIAAIRATGISAEIALALDEWAEIRHQMDRGGSDRSTKLVRLAMEVDGDSWRRDLRKAVLANEARPLVDILESNPGRDFPSATALFLSSALRRAGKPESSIELLRTVHARHPSDAPILLQLGVSLLGLESPRAEEAVGYLVAARALHPESAAILASLADAYAGESENEEAITSMRESARSDPRNATTYVRMGRLQESMGEIEASVLSLEKAVGLDPDLTSAKFELGVALQRKGDLDGASDSYRQAIEKDPRLAEAYNNLGACQYAKGDVDAALESYGTAIELDARSAPAHFNRALAHEKKREVPEALEDYQQSTRLDPAYADGFFRLGRLLRREKDVDGAIRCFRRVLEIDNRRAVAYYELGLDLAKKGDLDEAIKSCRWAVALEPRNAEYSWGLGRLLEQNGTAKAAIESYRKSIDIDSGFADAQSSLGDALDRAGDPGGAATCYRRAGEAYRKAVEVGKEDAAAHRRLAWFLATTNDPRSRKPEEAVRLAQRSVDLATEDGDCWNALGVARCGAGDWKGCVEALKRSIDLRSGGDPNDWLFLAVAYSKLGNADEGRSWYRAAVEWMDAHEHGSLEIARFRLETENVLGIVADPQPR